MVWVIVNLFVPFETALLLKSDRYTVVQWIEVIDKLLPLRRRLATVYFTNFIIFPEYLWWIYYFLATVDEIVLRHCKFRKLTWSTLIRMYLMFQSQATLLYRTLIGHTSILRPCSRRLSICDLWLILRAFNIGLKIRERDFIILHKILLLVLRVDWCTLDITLMVKIILTGVFIIIFRTMSWLKSLWNCCFQSQFPVEIWIFVFFRNE